MATQEQRLIAKAAANIFGGEAKVIEYWDNARRSSIPILICRDSPDQGLTSCSTIGLSDYNIGYTVEEKNLRVEICGASTSEFEYFPNIISTCAFNIINDKFACYPGAVYRNVVHEYYKDKALKHIVFVSPGMWEHQFENIEFDDKVITWLMAMPITEREFNFLQENSLDALETVFEDNQIDIFDLDRESAI